MLFNEYIKQFIKMTPINKESACAFASFFNYDTSSSNLSSLSASIYSKNGEDGILFYLLGIMENRTSICIEIGSEDIYSICANLVLHHNYIGYNVTADTRPVMSNRINFNYDDNIYSMENFKHLYHRITCNNVMDKLRVLCKGNIPRDIDVFALDIKGNDYWILRTIMKSNEVSPRVIVLNYQDILGPDRCVSVPYDERFSFMDHDVWNGCNYCGASLGAFKLLLQDEYALVGCEEKGYTAFFVRRDLSIPLKEVTNVQMIFETQRVKYGIEQRFPRVSHLEWVDIRMD